MTDKTLIEQLTSAHLSLFICWGFALLAGLDTLLTSEAFMAWEPFVASGFAISAIIDLKEQG